MARLADRPEIAALLKVDAEDKKLRDFGRKLVGPGQSRAPAGCIPVGCRALPRLAALRAAIPTCSNCRRRSGMRIVAPPGRLLVIADYSQIELRVAAELASEDRMRAVFAERRRSAPDQCGVVRRLPRGSGLRGGPLQGQGGVLRHTVRPGLARPGADGLERLAAGAGARGSRAHPGDLLPSLSAAARLAA